MAYEARKQLIVKQIWILLIGVMISLVGCEAEPPRIPFSEIDLSVADAGSGEKLFSQSHDSAPACSSCHVIEDESTGIGPSLEGLAEKAGNRVNGQSAEEYLYWSIVRPSSYLVTPYSNVMYADYEDVFDAADIADLIAYMLTLES